METQAVPPSMHPCDAPSCNRPVHGHEINAANGMIEIFADPPTHGNASHRYLVQWPGVASAPGEQPDHQDYLTILFQRGPINEFGVNGLTNEALLAIVADRLRSFQNSEYSCRENALALTKIEESLHWLHHRTQSRVNRGVEGTHAI